MDITKLTDKKKDIIGFIFDEVNKILEYDEESKSYLSFPDNFIISLRKDEYKWLKKIRDEDG